MSNPYYVDEDKPWFKPEAGWPAEAPKNLDFPTHSLYEALAHSAQRYRSRKAVWFLGTFMTYEELHRRVLSLAAGLAAQGIRKGDAVALILPNSFQYVIGYYACMRLGAIVTGVNPTYKPGEVLHQLRITGVKAVIVLDSLIETLLNPILKEYPIPTIIVTNIVDQVKMSGFKKWLGKKLGKIPTGVLPSGAIPFKDLMRTPPHPPEVNVSSDDVATYIMTGGTTGVPKAAVLSHFNCVSNMVQLEAWLYQGASGACNVGVLPLFHSFAMTCVMNLSVQAGMWMMLFPKPPDIESLLKTICDIGEDHHTFYCGAEVLFQRIADFPDVHKYPIADKLSYCISGAGPLHRPVQERFEKATGAVIVEGYGLSEASPVVCAGPLTKGVRMIGKIGLPMPGTDWKIMDIETGTRTLAPGEDGELWVAGPQVMVGYLNQPQETADTIVTEDGKRWLLTGDIGHMDEWGRVTISDRKKQLIKVRGYSVFPKEVEELVGSHPDVLEVAAAGLPDEASGEAIKVWIVLRPERRGSITEEEMSAWCKENITHYKVPKHIEFREDLPKTLVGKVMRRHLQEADPLFKGRQE